MHPPPLPAWANFTLMMECTPESSRCYSVYYVGEHVRTCFTEVERQRDGRREAFSELRGDKDSNKTTAKNSGSPSHILTPPRRKIRLIEGNAKCRHLKKFICKGTLRQVFICLRLRTPPPQPLRKVYVYTVYLFTQGRGPEGTVEPERRLEGQQFTKLGQKYQHD